MSLPLPVFISSAVAEAVFNWKDAVAAMQAVYSQPFTAGATPARVVARDDDGWLRLLSALPPGSRYYGAKIMAMATSAQQPQAQYVTVLFDRTTSRIAAFVDAAIVTGYRTAATSAAALDRIAPPGPIRLGVIGSGLEALMHVRAFAAIRPLQEVRIFSTTPERREAFARRILEELGVPTRAMTRPADACEAASVVLAAARARGERPTLFADWIESGAAVVSIGSTVPDQREVDVSVVARSELIVCDTVDEVVHETGDMIEAARHGVDIRSKSHSLNDLLQGRLKAQLAEAQMPMFKSVGGGLQDVSIAEFILTRALAVGLGTPLPIEFQSKTRT